MYGETNGVSVMDVRTDCFTDNGVAFFIQMYRFWLFPFHSHREIKYVVTHSGEEKHESPLLK